MDVKSEIRELKAEELDEVKGAGGGTVVTGLRATPAPVGGSDFTTEDGGGGGGGSKEYDGNKWLTFEN